MDSLVNCFAILLLTLMKENYSLFLEQMALFIDDRATENII